MLLKFHVDAQYNGEIVYKAGVHEVPVENGWARRWINRGAEIVEDSSKVVDISPNPLNTTVEIKPTGKAQRQSKKKSLEITSKEL